MDLHNKHKWREAEGAFERAVQLDPPYAAAWVLLAMVHDNQHRYAEALNCYEESLAISRRLGNEPVVAQTLYNIVLIHGCRRSYRRALPLAREAARLARYGSSGGMDG